MLSNVLYGERGAGRKTSAQLLAQYGIPLDAWDKEPIEPFVVPAAREEEEAEEGAA